MFGIKATNHFDLGCLSLCKGGFTKSSKGSNYWLIEQNDTELILSRAIVRHLLLDCNHLEQYSTEGNQPFADRTEKQSEFKLTGRR